MAPRIKGETPQPPPDPCLLCTACGSGNMELLSDMLASLSWACSHAGMKRKGPVFIFSHPTMCQSSRFFLKSHPLTSL